jgi:hypothetical protein
MLDFALHSGENDIKITLFHFMKIDKIALAEV